MPPNPQTQDGFKNKGGRLSGFSRTQSDAEAAYNVPAPKQAAVPARSDTPKAQAPAHQPAPTREETAKSSMVQLPSKTRRQTPVPPMGRAPPAAVWEFPSQSQPQVKETKKSPAKPKPSMRPAPQIQPQPEPEDEDATNRALFDGSQLGDDFMNQSRLTTPRTEPEDAFVPHQERQQVYQQPFEEDETVRPFRNREKESSQELGHDIVHHQKAQRRSSARLQVAENGRVTLNQPKAHRQERSTVRDGFSSEPLQEKLRQRDQRYTPASPVKTTTDLPYRPVKIKTQKKEQNRHRKQKLHDPSPYDNPPRQVQHAHFAEHDVIDLEDDEQPYEEAAQQTTPKPIRRIRKPQQQTLMESAMPPPSKFNGLPSHLRKRPRASLDYDDKALGQKTFGELLNEPFDLDPARGNDQGGDGNPLSNKLEHFGHQSEDEQRDFFASMKMDDWEESGDWLVDRFADLMKRMKDARREKRKVVANFETEASKRAEAVQKLSDHLDRKMQKMKQDGLRVVGERQA